MSNNLFIFYLIFFFVTCIAFSHDNSRFTQKYGNLKLWVISWVMTYDLDMFLQFASLHVLFDWQWKLLTLKIFPSSSLFAQQHGYDDIFFSVAHNFSMHLADQIIECGDQALKVEKAKRLCCWRGRWKN